MAKQVKTADEKKVTGELFNKENYRWMIGGAIAVVLGYLLMAGGNSDPKVFNAAEVYSTRRITIAPILILAGFILMIIGIMRKTGYEKEIK